MPGRPLDQRGTRPGPPRRRGPTSAGWRPRRAAALGLVAAVVCAASSAAAALSATGDGGSGTYTATGTRFAFALENVGTTTWADFELTGPPGVVFLGAATQGEATAPCTVGQPDGSADELECGPLGGPGLAPGTRLLLVATMASAAGCGQAFELSVLHRFAAVHARQPGRPDRDVRASGLDLELRRRPSAGVGDERHQRLPARTRGRAARTMAGRPGGSRRGLTRASCAPDLGRAAREWRCGPRRWRSAGSRHRRRAAGGGGGGRGARRPRRGDDLEVGCGGGRGGARGVPGSRKRGSRVTGLDVATVVRRRARRGHDGDGGRRDVRPGTGAVCSGRARIDRRRTRNRSADSRDGATGLAGKDAASRWR